jgi:16S rRNA processing protein RimM
VTVGVIGAPHGIKGAVKVEVLSDFPERFEAGKALWLDGRMVKIESSRWQGRAVVLQIEGVADRTAAEALRGRELQAPATSKRAPTTATT